MTWIRKKSEEYRKLIDSGVKKVKVDGESVKLTWRNFLNRDNRRSFDKKVKSVIKQDKIENFNKLKKYIDKIDSLTTLNKAVDKILKTNKNISKTLVKDSAEDFKKHIQEYLKDINFDNHRVHAIIYLKNGGTRYYTITNNNLEPLIGLIYAGILETENVNGFGSDSFSDIDIDLIEEIVFEKIEQPKKAANKEAKFFIRINNSHIDLTKYQIYNSFDQFKEHNTTEITIKDKTIKKVIPNHCILEALKDYFTEGEINGLRLSINREHHFPKKELKRVAKELNCKIVLHQNLDRGYQNKLVKTSYGLGDKIANIAFYDNHYFKYEETDETLNTINKSNRTRGKKLTSLQVVRYLDQLGYFSKCNRLLDYVQVNDVEDKEYILGDHIAEEQQLFEYTQNKRVDEKKSIFYADFETVTKNHLPFLGAIINSTNDEPLIVEYSGDMLNKIMNYTIKNSKKAEQIIIYYHNLKYDFTILKDLIVTNTCIKDNMLYSATVNFYGRKIELRDSYKMINTSLSKFQEELGLPEDLAKKEGIAYTFYSRNSINKPIVTLKEYSKYIYDTAAKENFYNNVISNKDEFDYNDNDKTFNSIKYYKYYLKYDVLVLRAGMQKFNTFIKEATEGYCNTFNYLTISSLVDDYFKYNGCYDNVCMTKGNLKTFLSRAVYGGRCAVNQTYKRKIIKNKAITDFDAVSLYPSSIYRLCKDGYGLPTGKAQIIKDLDNVLSLPYYVCKIKLLKVNKKQQIPFICYKNNKGSNYYNSVKKIKADNNIDVVELIVDKITLEDYIKFHEIEYEIIEGVYWSAFNNKIGYEIDKLFQKRKDIKIEMGKYSPDSQEYNQCNLSQSIVKLMLNSVYGKTIIKPSYSKYSIVSKSGYRDFMYRYYNSIDGAGIALNDRQIAFKVFSVDESHNFAHCGIIILSYSKRIMNEVFDVCNSNDINIYYQDTDSIHMKQKDVSKLCRIYKEEYGKDLIGKELCQFHEDFDHPNHKNNVSNYSVFYDKKVYLDVIEGDHVKTGERGYTTHIRMKGVNKIGIDYKVKEYMEQYSLNNINATKKIFEDILVKKVQFTLNPPEKCSFEFQGFNVVTRDVNTFTREIGIDSEEN